MVNLTQRSNSPRASALWIALTGNPFDARAMYFRPSDESGLGLERPATLLRDLDALESDTKAKSNQFERDLRAGGRPNKLTSWQVRAIARITLLGPPAASLILLTVDYFKYWRAISFDFADYLAAYFVFAIPAGYVFGAVPLLLAASLYCVLFTANPRLLQRRPLTRACVAALCGGLTSGVWFWFWQQLRIDWGIYVLVGALVMTALSLGTPPPAQVLEKGGSDRRERSTKSPGGAVALVPQFGG